VVTGSVPAPTEAGASSLAPGDSLTAGEHLISIGGNARLEMQGLDGNLVLYSGSVALI
jgi:hypothetical protein